MASTIQYDKYHSVWQYTKTFSLFKPGKHVKYEVITVQAGIMCEIIFQLLVEFYYRLLMILEQKYRDTDKSISSGKHFIR